MGLSSTGALEGCSDQPWSLLYWDSKSNGGDKHTLLSVYLNNSNNNMCIYNSNNNSEIYFFYFLFIIIIIIFYNSEI